MYKLTCEISVLLVLHICLLLVEYLPRHAIAVYRQTSPSATPAAEIRYCSVAVWLEKILGVEVLHFYVGKY